MEGTRGMEKKKRLEGREDEGRRDRRQNDAFKRSNLIALNRLHPKSNPQQTDCDIAKQVNALSKSPSQSGRLAKNQTQKNRE